MSLFGIPTLIAGIILLAAGSHWFSGATTVGAILTIASGAWIVLGIVIMVAMGTFAFKQVR